MKEIKRGELLFNNKDAMELIAYDDHFELIMVRNGKKEQYRYEYHKLINVQSENNILKLTYGEYLFLLYADSVQEAKEWQECLKALVRRNILHDPSKEQIVAPKQTDASGHVEIVCPKCGSNQVQREKSLNAKPVIAAGIITFAVAFIAQSSIIKTICFVLGIIELVLGIVMAIYAKTGLKKKEAGKWNVKCLTCSNEFYIEEPNGKYIITNLK